MGPAIRGWAPGVLVVLLCVGGGIAAPPEGGTPPAPATRAEKLRVLYRKLGYEERVREDVRAQLVRLLQGDARKAEESFRKMKWDAIDDFFLKEIGRRVDDKALDDLVPFLDTPEGQRMLALARLDRSLLSLDLGLAIGDRDGSELEAFQRGYRQAVEKAVEDSSPEAASGRNETAAIATLRNLASCQAQIQCSGKIDCDQDGIGEYATFLEMTGSTGVRKRFIAGVPASSDFSLQGTKVMPAILSPALAGVDADGIVTKKGYCFRIFLPDSGYPDIGFVHEKGPAEKPGLAGGTGSIGVDMSETTWCACAWPEKRGVTGTRAFCMNQSGDVLESPNTAAQWSGAAKAPPGNSAYLGTKITSDRAEGKKGADGDTWRICE